MQTERSHRGYPRLVLVSFYWLKFSSSGLDGLSQTPITQATLRVGAVPKLVDPLAEWHCGNGDRLLRPNRLGIYPAMTIRAKVVPESRKTLSGG